MVKLQFSIGILSWKGYDSLLNSLNTYEYNGLSKLTNHKYICLPEFEKEGIEIAKKFGYEPEYLRGHKISTANTPLVITLREELKNFRKLGYNVKEVCIISATSPPRRRG